MSSLVKVPKLVEQVFQLKDAACCHLKKFNKRITKKKKKKILNLHISIYEAYSVCHTLCEIIQ